MSEQLEIEFKNVLSASEYHTLLHYFQAKETDFFIQENHYFDTEEHALKLLGAGLRIRILSDLAELTLKTPVENNLLETTDTLSLATAHELLSKNKIDFQGAVVEKLKQLQIQPKEVHLIGSLKTKRFEKMTEKGLFVLDQSFYGEQVDCELELEVTEETAGEKTFNAFLREHQIERNPSKNKIARMLAYASTEDAF